MIDLLLFDALLAAVPPSARLILLGDPHQLASVDAGFVFGDLCRAAAGERHGPALVEHAAALGLRDLPARDAAAAPIRDAVVTLRRSYRFSASSGIGRLATAVRDGDVAAALAALEDADLPDVEHLPLGALGGIVEERVGPYARRLLEAPDPADALRHLERVRLLSAVRRGPLGVEGLNTRLEDWLLAAGLVVPGRPVRGRPIMITANDYDVELFNGDLGVLWPADGREAAYFPSEAAEPRSVAAYRLPAHETAWSTTVHKSQGSEFDEVILVLPGGQHDLLTRELLYTAVTRARQRVTILGEAETLRAAIDRPEQRFTGLAERIDREGPSREG